MEEKQKKDWSLKAGDKYYTVEIDLGALGKTKISLFKNPKFGEEGQPFAKSRNGAMWINEKKGEEEKIPEHDLEVL